MRKAQPQQAPISLVLDLQPKQLKLYTLVERSGPTAATILGYGGALGGGKSAAARRIMLARRYKYPKTKGIIVRRVLKDLKENHIDAFWKEYPQLFARWRATDKEIHLENGSVIGFAYAETAADVMRQFAGPEYFDIMVDQAEQFSEKELNQIQGRNRWPNVADGTCKTIYLFNPGGIGTAYLRRIFFLRQYQNNEEASNYDWIQAYGWDNYEWSRAAADFTPDQYYKLADAQRFEYFISKTQYGRKLNQLPPALREGHLLGSFEKFAGQYFAGVWEESKTVLDADLCRQLMQPWWRRWMALDWGFAHCTALFWATAGKLGPAQLEQIGIFSGLPLDVIIVYREMVVSEMGEDDLVREAAERTPAIEMKQIREVWIPPDTQQKKGQSRTVAEQLIDGFEHHGFPRPDLCDNDRVGGWRLLYNLWQVVCSWRDAAEMIEDVTQPLLFISGDCVELISTIPMLVRDPDKQEDVQKTDTREDDIADGLRYLIKSYMRSLVTAPVEVRRAEVWNSKDEINEKIMAMRRFNEKETQSRAPIQRKRRSHAW